MKRGKDDEKVMGPMFPRLHVNDTEKGGPRAPPRNKMALYEQLTTPSHRFNHGAFPPNSSDISNLVPAASTSQGSGTGQNLSRNSNASSRHLEQRRKIVDDDDFTVPVFVHSSLGKTQNGRDENNTIQRRERENRKREHVEASVSSKDHSVRSSMSYSTRDSIARSGNTSFSQKNDLPDANIHRSSKDNACLEQEPTVSVQQNDNRHGESVYELTREREKINNRGPIAVNDSCSGDNLNCQGEAEADSKFHGDKTCRSQQFVNGDKSDISETSAVDSITEVTITPDDVVGLIGQKRFWKARRAIVNQQRLFALQVFELHKLIKVQQLIAASPHLLLETGAYLAKPSSKVSPTKKLPTDYILVPPRSKIDTDKQYHKTEHSAENGVAKSGNHPFNHEPYMGNPTQTPNHTDNQTGSWGYHQWLVPVMSPSEGLVYKPYTPPGGVPNPFGSIPFNGNFFNPWYGAPPGFPPVGHGYFPPYCMPFMDPQGQSGGGFSGAGANFNMPHQSSCNLPTKKRGPDSQVTKPQASGESQVANSPSKKVQAVSGQATRAIKVVPHNRRSATESAARIFQSIQEERKQLDSD